MRLREQAYESFREHLLARRIRPGQFITQRELVAITGLTLGAIRELIPRLEADGLIATVPQRGMQVAHLDMRLVRNAFEFRQILEREAVARFARAASDAEIERWWSAHRRIRDRAAEAAGPTDDLVAEAQAVDWGFHDALIDALDNEILSNAYRVNSIKIRLIGLERARLSPTVLIPSLGEHLTILDAIRARDPAPAQSAMDQHIASARHRAMGAS